MTARLRHSLPALLLFLGGLGSWEVVVRLFHIKSFILPAPSAVATAFLVEWDELRVAGLGTLASALGGLALGSVAAAVAALGVARWPGVRAGMMPFSIAANSAPIVVVAPIANSWFGLLSPWSSIMVVGLLVFFPVMINLVKGLLAAEDTQLELMSSYAADPGAVLTKLRLPGAMPYLFSALRVAGPLSLIGAIVKEYFGGSQQRLGQYITLKAGLFQFAEAWAAIVVASACGIAMFAVIALIERRVIPWHASLREN